VVIVSYIFDVGDETVWSPSLRTGRLYVGLTSCLADLTGLPTGLSAVADDMYEIEIEPFRTLVDAVAQDFHSTDHPVYRGQLRGWLVTSLVLLRRAGRPLPAVDDADRELPQEQAAYAKAMPS
jgi:Family of unknown function (DUF6086)